MICLVKSAVLEKKIHQSLALIIANTVSVVLTESFDVVVEGLPATDDCIVFVVLY